MKGFSWSLCAVALLLFGLCVSSAAAVNPSLSGSMTLHFSFHPDDPETPEVNESFWSYSGHSSGGTALSVPSVLDITTVGAGNFNWNNPASWTTFPLNTGGYSVNHTGSGSFNYQINNGNANLNVLGGSGPTEASVGTNVSFSNITPSGGAPCCDFSVLSNVVATRYNVTLPTGAHLNDNLIPTLQNLTINSGASINQGGFTRTIRQNLTNHGSGEFNDDVEGNFINDAVAAGGNVANAVHLDIVGQLLNTGELYVPQYLKTQSATSNAGSIFLNGGTFLPQAAFANNGTIEFSAGSLDGPGVVTNNGTFDWSGGQIASDVVNTTSSFTISGPNSRYLGGSLTNSGTITHSGGNIFSFAGTAVLTNQAGGLFDITDDSQMYDGAAVGTLDNAGTFRKSGGSGVTIVGPKINNTGTITVTSGSLRFLQGGTLDGGTMSFANGGSVDLNNGNFFLQGSITASGNGTLEINGGSARGIVSNGDSVSIENFTGGADLILGGAGELRTDAGGTLTLNLTGTSAVKLAGPSGAGGGRIGGAGMTINEGNFEWVHGTVSGNLRNDSVNFTISSTESHYIEGGILTNTSTITHSGDATVNINLGGALVNQPGTLYDITGDGDITAGAITDTVTNAGTFRKSGGSGTSVITTPLTNTGTVAIDSGTMLFAGPNALVLDESGTLAFQLAGIDEGTDYGKVDVSHELVADGTLEVSLEAGFAPGSGDSFNILDWQMISGAFDDVQLPSLATNLEWDTSQLYVTGVLAVALPGDFNLDDKVDAADYVVWRTNETANNPLPNDAGLTTQAARFDLWRGNFGEMTGGGSGASTGAVPEPAGVLLAVIAALAVASRRREIVAHG